jgi:hypothetical protein
MTQRSIDTNERVALCLAPFFSIAPLLPIFGLRASPLFLGRLMDDPTHPMNWPVWGPWLSSTAVVFDGTILAYVVALLFVLPVYLSIKPARTFSVMAIFALGGVLASQLVHLLQGFRQPDLSDFANSWLSPLLGCLCGLTAALFFAWFARRRWTSVTRSLLCSLPVASIVACGFALVESAKVWRSH